MLVAGAGLGVYVRRYRLEVGDNAKWEQEQQKALREKVSLELTNTPVFEASLYLRQVSNWRIHALFSPELGNETITLKVDNMPLNEALTRACELISAEWDVRNGALFIYPKGKTPHLPKTAIAHEKWEADTLKKLSRHVTLEMADEQLSTMTKFIGELVGIRMVFDPTFREPEHPLLNICAYNDRRAFDALTCLCFMTGAEWKLKQGTNGEGEIWIYPAGK